MVQSSAQPNARARESGGLGVTVDPFQSTVATRASNTTHDMQFEFAKVESVAGSPWRAAPTANPDYHDPIVASSLLANTTLKLEVRGADDALGTGLTPWFTDIDNIDGKPFLQYRFTFVGDHVTGQVPSVDALVIPVN